LLFSKNDEAPKEIGLSDFRENKILFTSMAAAQEKALLEFRRRAHIISSVNSPQEYSKKNLAAAQTLGDDKLPRQLSWWLVLHGVYQKQRTRREWNKF
jgi:UDP-glucose 4-epimerase